VVVARWLPDNQWSSPPVTSTSLKSVYVGSRVGAVASSISPMGLMTQLLLNFVVSVDARGEFTAVAPTLAAPQGAATFTPDNSTQPAAEPCADEKSMTVVALVLAFTLTRYHNSRSSKSLALSKLHRRLVCARRSHSKSRLWSCHTRRRLRP